MMGEVCQVCVCVCVCVSSMCACVILYPLGYVYNTVSEAEAMLSDGEGRYSPIALDKPTMVTVHGVALEAKV